MQINEELFLIKARIKEAQTALTNKELVGQLVSLVFLAVGKKLLHQAVALAAKARFKLGLR